MQGPASLGRLPAHSLQEPSQPAFEPLGQTPGRGFARPRPTFRCHARGRCIPASTGARRFTPRMGFALGRLALPLRATIVPC